VRDEDDELEVEDMLRTKGLADRLLRSIQLTRVIESSR